MTTRDDIHGLEYDWLAADPEGYIGLLSTAGGGYVPGTVLRSLDALNAAIGTIVSLPARTSAECNRELPAGLTNTWRLVAERGFFAFDSDAHGGPYRLIAAPLMPVRLHDLPVSVRDVAGVIVLAGVAFRTATEITEADVRGAESLLNGASWSSTASS